jgi:tRNA-binding EMAP/Myf-like protein
MILQFQEYASSLLLCDSIGVEGPDTDLGEDYGHVTILTGLAQFYSPEDFTGKNFMFLANLDPKPMAGKVSQGMLFAADGPEKPILIEAPNDLAPGTMLR